MRLAVVLFPLEPVTPITVAPESLMESKKIWVEVVKVLLIVFITDLFTVAHPFMARGERIQSPVNEQAKTIVQEPVKVSR